MEQLEEADNLLTGMNEIIGAASCIIESAEKVRNEVTVLAENVLNNKEILETLETARKELQNLISENSQENEYSHETAAALKALNNKFIAEAKMVCTSITKMNEMIDSEKQKVDKIDERVKEDKKMYDVAKEEYELQEKELLNEIEKIEQMIRPEIDENITPEENSRILHDLGELEQEIGLTKGHLSDLEKSQAERCQEIYQLKREIAAADVEIVSLPEKLQSIHDEKSKEIENLSKNNEIASKKLEELEAAFNECLTEVEKSSSQKETMTAKLLSLEKAITENGERISELTHQNETLATEYEESENRFIKEEENCNTKIKGLELDLNIQRELNEQNILDEKTLKDDLITLESEIEPLNVLIHEMESRPDPDIEIETRQTALEKLEVKMQEIQEQERREQELMNEKMEEIGNEILDIENENSANEQKNKLNAGQVNEMKVEVESLKEKELVLEQKIKQKTEEGHQIDLQIEKKNQVLKKQNKTIKTPLAPKKLKNWDSDTTIEEEDRSFAEKVKRSIIRKDERQKKKINLKKTVEE